MTTQELYELLSRQLVEMDTRFAKHLTEMDARFTKQLTEMGTRFTNQLAEIDARHTRHFETLDSRLRNVEVDVAEIKGRKAGWESALNFG